MCCKQPVCSLIKKHLPYLYLHSTREFLKKLNFDFAILLIITTMEQNDANRIIREFYLHLGGPGSQSSINKLYSVLKRAGYNFSQKQIHDVLKTIAIYNIRERRYKEDLPKYVSSRISYSSKPFSWMFCDSAYSTKTWFGPQKYFFILVDHWSHYYFARAMSKINAANALRSLKSIIDEDLEYTGKGPIIENLVCDRG